MPFVQEEVEIRAAPEVVFDLIANVEEFPRYVDSLKEVKGIGPDTYRWTVVISGAELDWDSVFTERVRPKRIAWKSIRGVDNSGSFTLQPTPAGTLVRFTMEFRIANRLMEITLSPVLSRLTRKVAEKVMARVKSVIETKGNI